MEKAKKLLLDSGKTYAIALEGGGARGAYQVGVWRALSEAGIKYNAVSGSSVGALNGALMAMRALDRAEDIWANIKYSSVMDVDDGLMKSLFSKKPALGDLKSLCKYALSVLREGGIDVTPLREWIAEVVDEEALRKSDVELYVVTYSVSDRRELDLDVRELPEGEIGDMLLASAYFPAFKNEKIRGKRYSDGGVQDVVPINSLISRGYEDIIVVRIYGVGVEKRVKIPESVSMTTIAPTEELGSVLNFEAEHARELMRLGYYDAHRALYGYTGRTYYLKRTISEDEAYDFVAKTARSVARRGGEAPTLRRLNEELIPEMAGQLGVKGGDYYDIFLACIEPAARDAGLERFRLLTDRELLEELRERIRQPE